jgi:hypothetical protein
MTARPPSSRWARWCVILALGLPLLIATAIVTDNRRRARQADQAAALWFERLDLSLPALWPAGTPQRHPETLWPGVDLRLMPAWPLDPLTRTLPPSDDPRLRTGRP